MSSYYAIISWHEIMHQIAIRVDRKKSMFFECLVNVAFVF